MSSPTNISRDRLRTNWTPTMERYFIDIMLDQVHRGNRMGHTFNKQTWNDMLITFNAKFGSQYDIDILKSHYTNLCKQFNDIRNLLDQDGFSWDNARQMVVAENNIWDSVIRAHPDVQSYRNRPLINFNDLCLIYAHTTADGRYSISSHDLDFDDDMIGLCIGVGTNGPVNKECSRADWTLAMDECLVKLMVDQVRKGSRINGGFKKQAWRDMITFFNAEFGYQHGKSFLKYRFRKLKTYYDDLRSLLETRGFSWDEKHQMVVADADVWDKYIKANPDACAYKNRTLLNFLDLCLIYGDSLNNGQCTRTHQLEHFECGILPQETEGQDTPCLADSDSPSTRWSPDMDGYFIDLMLDIVRKAKNIDYNNDLVWTNMIASFKGRFGFIFNQEFLKRRCKSFEKQYYDLRCILEQEGFWWDEKGHIVTAYNDTWAANIKDHPHAKSYISDPLPSYNDLCLIFGNSISDQGQWHNQLGQKSQNIAYHGARSNNDSYHWRSDWTPQMDRYFIDLMLCQVRTGSMVDQNFNKLAWNDMVSKFSAEFGSQHDEDVLKSRFLNLRKRFHDMKFLLDQDGFVWDELQQMIVAEDILWDACIQEYPHARSYHNRALPNLNELFLIFGNDITADNHHFNTVDDDDGYLGVNIGEEEQQFVSGSGQVRIQWMNEMDNYLVDLMVEQVHKGNKIGSTFTDQAWTWMIVLFNRRFGVTCDIEVLEDRYLSLMEEYKDVKNMVDEKNVTWNGIHESVMTDDEVWETRSKECPGDDDVCTGRIVDRYDDLCFIYADGFLGERSSSLGTKVEVEENARRTCRSNGFKEYEHSERECEIFNQRKKLKSVTPSTSAGSKKIKRIKEEMKEVASKKGSYLVDNAENKDYNNSIETIVAALQSVPEMNDELFLEACKVLEDEREAKIFIAMDVMERKEWLSKKLRH